MGFDLGIALAEKQAREILEDLGLDHLARVDLRDVAFHRGLLVEYRTIRGAEGRLVRRGDRAIATVDDSIWERGKRRFVAAHELGHFELHLDEPAFVCDTSAFLDWRRRRPLETEANRFAAELLMPKAAFLKDAKGPAISFDVVRTLSDVYGASLTAAAFRYVHLNVCPCALVCCTDGRVSWSIVSASFPYKRIRRGGNVHAHTGAGEYFDRGMTSNDPEPTPTAAWFLDGRVERHMRCYEHCIPMPTYRSTLSLIWDACL